MAKLVIGTDKTVGVPAVVKEVVPVEKYPLLGRVKDDNNTEIGTVVGFRKDSNNNQYAVVCLDAQYRGSGQFCNNNGAIPGLPLYSGNLYAFDATETATFNCDKTLEFCAANNYTSSAISLCRSKSFLIDGVTYYGQMPTIAQLMFIIMNRTDVNSLDTSAASNPNLIVKYNGDYASSTQMSSSYVWMVANAQVGGFVYQRSRTMNVLPILEIPIQ